MLCDREHTLLASICTIFCPRLSTARAVLLCWSGVFVCVCVKCRGTLSQANYKSIAREFKTRARCVSLCVCAYVLVNVIICANVACFKCMRDAHTHTAYTFVSAQTHHTHTHFNFILETSIIDFDITLAPRVHDL